MPTADKRQRKKENARMAREAREAADRRSKRLRTARNVGIAVAVIVIGIVLINVIAGDDEKKSSASTTTVTPESTVAPKVKLTGFIADPEKTYTANIKTNYGTIVVALDSTNAPVAAGRFIELARKGYYDGTKWHRVAKNFMIQGGDPEGTGSGNTGNAPAGGEVPEDHYPIGAIAGAKTQSDPPGAFDAQFFIVTGPKGATLPNDYAWFGIVSSGMNFAEQINALAPAANNGDGPPTGTATIDKITITES